MYHLSSDLVLFFILLVLCSVDVDKFFYVWTNLHCSFFVKWSKSYWEEVQQVRVLLVLTLKSPHFSKFSIFFVLAKNVHYDIDKFFL